MELPLIALQSKVGVFLRMHSLDYVHTMSRVPNFFGNSKSADIEPAVAAKLTV